MNSSLQEVLRFIAKSQMPDGGFENISGTGYQTEATIWASLALKISGQYRDHATQGLTRLTHDQKPNGSIVVQGLYDKAWWTTPLTILCWHGIPDFETQKNRAVEFLLANTGVHFPRNQTLGHDTSIRGWPWIEKTHSWIDPTSFALIALKLVGQNHHLRVKEGIAMILDRQLPDGTWNYGNTIVYNNILKWLPENTATALCGLSELVELPKVEKGIQKLASEIPKIRTPWTLSWTMLAMNTWKKPIENQDSHFMRCLENEKRCGDYGIALKGLLATSWLLGKGLSELSLKKEALS